MIFKGGSFILSLFYLILVAKVNKRVDFLKNASGIDDKDP